MDTTAQLIAAIGALWSVLTAVVSKALLWLLADRKEIKAECAAEIARRDAKIDAAADLLVRQNASMQKQIDALQAAINKGATP